MRYALFLTCLLAVSSAGASDSSISLYSEGLVELHRGDLIGASALMDRAVGADPQDPYARYYRGVVRGRSGDNDGAIEDLRAALSIKPDFPEAQLDLGVALIESEQYAEAEPLLAEASRNPDLSGNAVLFLGIARLRQGESAASLVEFDRVPSIDPSLANTALYYRAVALRRLGRSEEARQSFEQVVANKPGSQIAAEATNFLDALASGKDSRRRWEIHGGYGVDYDSNVILRLDGESSDDLGVSDDSDFAFNLRLGGRYSVWRGENTAVSVSYDFFQRLYLELDDYNLQGHLPSLQWTGRWDAFRFGVSADYEFYLLKVDAYMQRVGAQPWVAWQAGDWGRTELSYQFRWNDFFKPPPGDVPSSGIGGDFSDSADALDSFSHKPRLRQYFYIDSPRRYVALSYLYERREPAKSAGDPFGFDANQVEVAFASPLIYDFDLFASYAYRREDYDQGGRVDEPHVIVAVLRWPIATWFAVSVGYFGELHNSNQFEYNRHIGSIGFDLVY